MAERKSKAQTPEPAADPEAAQTTTTAVEDETTTQPRGLVAQTDAAPLEPPAERKRQQEPADGVPESTTNHVAANAALRSVPGSSHQGLVDEDGNPLTADEVFDFPAAGNPSTFATVKTRVYERFKYPNASQVTTQLLYPAGAQVPVWIARQVTDKYRDIQENQPS
ncbi:hypothetical protein ACFFMN_22955 [Planobispora siamensis]|uniref:Uncharacterized protein n=1 Tax=Planobispora siamensis TaxID=936338 RepID=A0A8J3SM82_9ACTN|nr:hypothetical protein [Planobispora siamensis]GIH95427.1 hypothetical protein Psi01_60570 [Planobispora siamensis]